MKIKIVKIAADKQDPFVQAGHDYLKKSQQKFKIEVLSLKERNSNLDKECEDLLKNSEKYFRIALDADGKIFNSEQFANFLEQKELQAQNIAFLIGSASGLSQKLKDSVDLKISLSSMTFPHRMAFLMLSEQIYRSSQILTGGPYHK